MMQVSEKVLNPEEVREAYLALQEDDGEVTLEDMDFDFEREIMLLSEEGVTPEEENLSEGYVALRLLGVSAIEAYEIVSADHQSVKEKHTVPPPVIGRVNAKTIGEKDYFSPEEVDRLTEEDLKDERVLQYVMNSMTKWKR